MKTHRAFRLMFITIAPFTGLSCGGDGRISAGDVCKEISDAYCDREVECGEVTDKQDCVNEAVNGCCSEIDCNAKAENDEQEQQAQQILDDCSNALDNFSCDSLEEGGIPAACIFEK